MFPIGYKYITLLSSLKWTLDQCFSLHATCSSAKGSLAFWFFLLMRGLVTAEWAFSPNSLKRWDTVCRDRSLPCSSLNCNSSCSVDPIAQLVSSPYTVLFCNCLSWTDSLFADLKWINDIVKMQHFWNHRLGTTNFSCYGCCRPSSGQPAIGRFQSL